MNRLLAGLTFAACLLSTVVVRADAKPLYQSPIVTQSTAGNAVDIDVRLPATRDLYLVVRDGGNGFSCDWADWCEPRLVGGGRELKLTELKWKSAVADWGQVRVNANAGGGPLRINGRSVEFGIGTHANSVIHFEIPEGFERFRARGGLDNGGTDQGDGTATSVQFLVYASQPPAAPGEPGRDASQALDGLDVHADLEATVFAAEPMLLSPSNIDVDHRGRVWVCEIVNYRRRNGERPEGDRILILDDTDGDGVADKQTVFYQGRDIDTALGICVLGNQVIVSVAPNVFVFTDDDGDGKADRKETLFTKVGQPQHDHSTHAFTFGPDGRLYWNFGNTGKAVHDRNGQVVRDVFGHEVVDNGRPYYGGMVFRCRPDGSEFEVLAHNFRNNYEVAVDSFGSLWQSDNDDDGNQAVRINYVMEYGNYGYLDEMTGAGWREPRTGMKQEIPLRHWHLNDPGVVPNLLQTGQGSPTGICVYEGRLLPRVFWDQVIHCDAGPNVVRAYPAERSGAGYTARIVNILEGSRDKWFRPSDVCVAPDGSLIVADWYDPGVGGHRMGDVEKGRIFRIAPPGTPYRQQPLDLSSATGAIQALQSPNHETRYLAWQALHKMGDAAADALWQTVKEESNPRFKARALWLLSQQESTVQLAIQTALEDANPDLRITGLRMARRTRQDLDSILARMAADTDPQVRRECLIALHNHQSEQFGRLWTRLALQYDGQDRWYLEALGIAADGQWEDCLATYWARRDQAANAKAVRDIVWRSRAPHTPRLIADLITDPETPVAEIPRYLRAFDFHPDEAKQKILVGLALGELSVPADRRTLVASETLGRVKGVRLDDPQYKAALERILKSARGTAQFVSIVEKFELQDQYPELLEMACRQPDQTLGVAAIRALLQHKQHRLIQTALSSEDQQRVLACVEVLKNSLDGRATGPLLAIVKNEQRSIAVRRAAVRGVTVTRPGALKLIEFIESGALDERLNAAVAAALHASPSRDIKEHAVRLYPLPPSKNSKPLPPLSELVNRRGDAVNGRKLFATTGTCAKCHVVGQEGKEVGPNLTEIGSKLSRQAMFESIIYPSAGISHNYENYLVVLDNGTTANGVIATQNADTVSLKGADAIVRTFKKSEIDEMVKLPVSMMPADLTKVLSVEELTDIVEFMTTLKKKGPSKAASED